VVAELGPPRRGRGSRNDLADLGRRGLITLGAPNVPKLYQLARAEVVVALHLASAFIVRAVVAAFARLRLDPRVRAAGRAPGLSVLPV